MVDTIDSDLRAAYARASESALVVEQDPPGVLLARGADVIDFLQRMSTNDMSGLRAGSVRGTILTNAIGRTIDWIHVVPGSDAVRIVTSPGQAGSVRSWLSRYIFFQDDVILSEPETDLQEWGLFGPASAQALEAVTGVPLELQGDEVLQVGAGLAWRVSRPVPGIRLLADPATHERCLAAWGASSPTSPERRAFTALRIEHGFPAFGHEITSDVIPLEVELWDQVSFEKGCYIGQEVIARMESRGRVARRLVGVALDQVVSLPQDLVDGSTVTGAITSVALSPVHGPIGMALVRTTAGPADGQTVRCRPAGTSGSLRSLPF